MIQPAIKDPLGERYAKALESFVKAKKHILNGENPRYYDFILGRSLRKIAELLRAMNNQSRRLEIKLACHEVLRESDIKLIEDWMAVYQYNSFV